MKTDQILFYVGSAILTVAFISIVLLFTLLGNGIYIAHF